MSEAEIKHFLVRYNVEAGRASVQPLGEDYDRAMDAYAEAEEKYRDDANLDIVLLSADSLDTVKRTHSSYFATEETFESLLPEGMLSA